jgi:transposase
MTGTISIVQAGGTALGVDTHKDMNVAFAIDHLGRRVDERSAPTTESGSNDLLSWARQLGPDRVWGVEGTGSYGAGLTRVLQAAGETVHEVCRPNRRVRRNRGKSDPIDAEVAARNVLAGQIQGAPRAGTGVIESLRQLRATRRSALKARTQAANLLHALLLTAPADIRAELDQGSLKGIVQRCTRLRPGPVSQEREACKFALRSAARRWRHLAEEIAELDISIAELTAQAAPALLDQFGVGPNVAAALLIAAGGNPERLGHEASFAALCGVSPIPASSGKTNRHRLNRGGDRQANCALHTVAMVRMRSDPRTRAYVARRTSEGLSSKEIKRCIKRYIARELYPLIVATLTG